MARRQSTISPLAVFAIVLAGAAFLIITMGG